MYTPIFYPQRPSRKHSMRAIGGFTLIELLTVIGIFAILAAILIPVASKVRANANASACLSNLRQLGAALHLYTSDNGGEYPPNRFNKSNPNRPGDPDDANRPGPYWQSLLAPYVEVDTNVLQLDTESAGVFYCPADERRATSYPVQSYGSNQLIGLSMEPLERLVVAAENPANTLWLIDMTRENGSYCVFSHSTWPFAGSASDDMRIDFRHNGQANGAFLDGSVRSFTVEELSGEAAYEKYSLR